MTDVPWQPTDDGKQLRCIRHPTVAPFARNRTCAACDAHPGPILTEPAAPPPVAVPEGCLSVDQHEAALTEVAKDATTEAKMLCRKGKARINWSTAAKLYEIAIKAHRAAAELAHTRARRSHVRWLQAQRDKLRGARGGN